MRTIKTLPCCNLVIWACFELNIFSFGWSLFHDSGKCCNCGKQFAHDKKTKTVFIPESLTVPIELPNFLTV